MPITKNDIKLLRPERPTEDADGGGYMTGQVIQDGVENNVFPDVSSVDRAQGAIDMQKVFGAVLTDDTSVYLGAHLILDEVPADPAVSCVLVVAASASEIRSQLLTRLNGTLRGVGPYYGTRPLLVAGAVGDRVVYADGIDEQLIPVSNVGVPVSGALVVAESSAAESVAYALVAAGAPLPAEVQPAASGAAVGRLGLRMRPMPAAVSGTVDPSDDSAVALAEAVIDGLAFWEYSTSGGLLRRALPSVSYYDRTVLEFSGPVFDAGSVSYTPALRVTLPAELVEFTFTSGMSPVQLRNLPFSPAPGSESIAWEPEGYADMIYLDNTGPDAFTRRNVPSDRTASATVDRTTGQITMLLDPPPKVGTKVRITYVRSGYARALAASALGAGGVLASSQVTVTPSTGWRLRAAVFRIGTAVFDLLANGQIRRRDSWYSALSSVAGSYDADAGVILLPGYDGQAIADWRAVEDSVNFPTQLISGGQIEADIDPATLTLSGETAAGVPFTATAASNGAFATALVTGTYDRRSGRISLAFSAEVGASSITYEGVQSVFSAAPDSVSGLQAAQFPTSGRVPVLAQGNVVVVHHTAAMAPQAVANGTDVDLGRTRVADARVFGANGVEIVAGFTLNKATGHLVFSNVSGYSQPVTIRHRVEDMALVTSLDVTGKVSLSRPLSHTFPLGSRISSALVTGDMHARAREGFAQQAWTDAWSDTLIGAAPLADFNSVIAPIEVTNRGAIKERWVVRFTGSTAFRIVGEQVGEIVSNGSTGADIAPINPATGVPYFTIPFEGWGTGWAGGNVYRFNTDGANAPAWVLRCISPSEPYAGQVRVTVAQRGDIDA